MPQYPDWKQCNLKSGPTGCDGLELVNEMEEKERGKKKYKSDRRSEPSSIREERKGKGLHPDGLVGRNNQPCPETPIPPRD